ncbi:MAG: flagellar export protein FliJ [Rugosibacter sp.]|jgi:flagellar FliJ protein|nr:flagellar export protein FliJ [Rugosibacter sp.]MDO9273140.1 flagellar export protein FliJ [Rugosibacter sp.]
MASSFSLQPLLDLSRFQLDEAARKLGELIAGEQEASQRHSLLVTYREEYQARFLEAAKNGLGQSQWSNYSSFLARIDEAIIQAALSVTLTQQRTLAGQQNWVGRQGRVKAFDTLSERHHAQVTAQEQRANQKSSDEHTARQHSERNNNEKT